jgi:acylglycerol lipase
VADAAAAPPSPTTELLAADDGTALSVREWLPGAAPRAGLLILHGVGEHGGRFDDLASRLARGGIAVLVPDLRGHGRSAGPRVHVPRWDRFLDDARVILGRLRGLAPGAPVFVYGQSMGSVIALDLAARGEPGVGGWIVSGAGIEPTGVAKPHLVAIARLLTRIAPKVPLDLGIRGQDLSHDPGVIRGYDEDPLVGRRATVRLGTEALDAVARVKATAGQIREPLLILHGGEDPVCRPSGSRWLASATAGETELIVYEGARHEPHNDREYADAAGDILRWIGDHATAAAGARA